MWDSKFSQTGKMCLISKQKDCLQGQALPTEECVGLGMAPHQVFIGQPGDLVLQAGLDAGLRGQLQVLSQQLLLPVVLLLQALDLAAEGFGLILMAPFLGLELGFQEPGEKPHK